MEKIHGDRTDEAYKDVIHAMKDMGFSYKSGLYIGDNSVNAVTCVLAVQDLITKIDWLMFAGTRIQMLRITEDSDLMPAVK
jgi:virulence-associated protein VapD